MAARVLSICLIFVAQILVSDPVLASDKSVKEMPFHHLELRTAPFALFLFKWMDLDISYRFSEQFAFGPSFIRYADSGPYGNMFTPTYEGTAYGFHGYYYYSSVLKSGWYSGFRGYYENYKSYSHHLSPPSEVIGYRGRVTTGANFKLNHRVNLMLGLGVEYFDRQIQDEEEERRRLWFPIIELKLGVELF